jgi:hypothetical protein
LHFVNDTDNLVKSVLHKNSLEECDTELLTGLITEYPYAAVFHILLMAKLKDKKIAGPAQQRLSELYFSNPLWLKQVNSKENIIRIEDKYPAVTHNREEEVERESEVEEIEVAENVNTEESADLPAMKIAPLEIRPLDPNATLTFEPFHTVDYFASQGIKISDNERPKDKFGQQLKSFTDWLKTLKKAPDGTEVAIPAVAEQKVEQMAMHSLDQSEVVTEAMAEVWEKQGNHKEARAVYDKLKLLNPSKSAYFAAKIEQLK